MTIIEKTLTTAYAVAFWAAAMFLVVSFIPRTEGTLLDCKFNNKMDQSICKPFTMKNRSQ